MISINIYPANKQHFIKLKEFAEEIINICNGIGITLFAYGSLASFGYTKNTKITINDIDFFILDDSFEKITAALDKKDIKYKYIHSWHSLQIFKDNLRIEIDYVDFQYKDLPKKSIDFDFSGLKTKVITLDILKSVYKNAARTSKDNPEKYNKKFNALENINA